MASNQLMIKKYCKPFAVLYHHIITMCLLFLLFVPIMKEIILYYWLTTGPLLYHFADMPNEVSIELCYEDIHRIAEEKIGFQFLVRY